MNYGYELIPLGPDNVPTQSGWQLATTPPLDMESLAEHYNIVGPHFGVRLGPEDLVVDVDVKNPRLNGAGSARALGLDLGSFPTVCTPSGGLHHFMKKPADHKTVVHLKDYPGIDFLSEGHYVVAVGCSYKKTGFGEYEWDLASPGLPASNVPESLLALLEKKERPAQLSEDADWTPEMLAEFLAQLDPEVIASTNDDWLRIASACHEVTGGDGEDEFLAWSARDPMYSNAVETNRARWRSFTAGKPGNSGIGTLRSLALDSKVGLPAGRAASDFDGIVEDDEEIEETPMQMLSRQFCAVAEGGKVYVVENEPTREGERSWYASEQFFKLTKAVLKMRDEEIPSGEKVRYIPAGQYWFDNYRKKETYVGATLEPLQGKRTADGRLNLWRGFAVDPKEGDWSLLKAHILEILSAGDQAVADYIMDWCALTVQRPDKPGEVALVMQGGQGVGKGALGSALARLFGAHGAEIRSREHLTGRFNHHLRDKVVLFADEAVWSGNKEAESVLKGMITEKRLAYERKGADIVWAKNLLHIIMASNEDWVAPVAWDDRRYAIFRTADEKRSRAYFDALFKQLDEGGYEAMLKDLLERDIAVFHPLDDRPNTAGLRDQKRRSMAAAEQWLLAIMEDGRLEAMCFERGGVQCAFRKDLHASFVGHMSSEGLKTNAYSGLSEQVGRAVSKMLPLTTRTLLTDPADNERKNAYRFVALSESIRKALSNAG